jgi:hypothetical protein
MSTADAANRYFAFMRGWGAGTRGHRVEEDGWTHPVLGETYQEGYAAGRAAKKAAQDEASARFGYVPQVIRARAGEEGKRG